MPDYVDMISKLLNQAERTSGPESDVFTERAQQIASKYSIDLAMARARVARTEQRETPTHRTVRIGERRALGNSRLVALFLRVAAVNDVRCDIASNSTFVIAYGFGSDLEVVEAMYASLSVQMVGAANAYLRTGAHSREMRWNSTGTAYGPTSGRTARLEFYDGWIDKVGHRLAEAARQARAEAEQATTDHGSSMALVLVEKEKQVAEYRAGTSRARGAWNPRMTGASNSHAVRAGTRAGADARLRDQQVLPEGHRQLG